jgi:hypothetical protein
MALAGGVGLLVAAGETASGKSATFQQLLTESMEGLLEAAGRAGKACVVSVLEVRGAGVRDLLSTAGCLEPREDAQGELRGAEGIENRVTSVEQFGQLFTRATRSERRTRVERSRAHLLCRSVGTGWTGLCAAISML